MKTFGVADLVCTFIEEVSKPNILTRVLLVRLSFFDEFLRIMQKSPTFKLNVYGETPFLLNCFNLSYLQYRFGIVYFTQFISGYKCVSYIRIKFLNCFIPFADFCICSVENCPLASGMHEEPFFWVSFNV